MAMLAMDRKRDYFIVWILQVVFYSLAYWITGVYEKIDSNLFVSIVMATGLTVLMYWQRSGKYLKDYVKYLLLIWLGLNLLWFVWLVYEKGGLNALRPFHYYAVTGYNTLFVLVLYWMSRQAQKQPKD